MNKLTPWHIAVMRRAVMAWVIIPYDVVETYWKTWHDVYRGGK